MYKTQPKGSDEELSSDESEDEMDEGSSKKPELNAAVVPHHGCVNRLRFNFVGERPLVASWSELGKVCIWDVTTPLRALDSADVCKVFNFMRCELFAMNAVNNNSKLLHLVPHR